MSEMRITLAQIDVTPGEPARNLERAREAAASAAERESDLLLLPELWGSGYDLTRAEQHATRPGEGLFAEMAALAREHRLWVGGSLLGIEGKEGGRPRNLFALYNPQGELAASYAKLHLFRLMDEEKWLGAGTGPTLAALPGGSAGLAICYDLRFPELFRHYALAGARLILLPAEWPHPRLSHWQTLLRARAIENQCFVVACNRTGEDPNGTRFFGHSAIIDPWGETIVEAGEAPCLLSATLDLSQVEEIRRRIPVFEDRRTDLYESIFHNGTER